jgi:competence protein ComEA
MGEIPKQQLAVYAAAALAIVLIGARYVKESESSGARVQPPRPAPALNLNGPRSRVVVHVTGAVRRPGVYRIPSWARLDLAVRRAGGPARTADLGAVNLAARVADGQQIVVPARAGRGAGGVNAEAATAARAGGQIGLNTATTEQLDELEGIGPATAEKILEWRKQHGGFSSVDDLKQVTGIGPKRFEALKDEVRP